MTLFSSLLRTAADQPDVPTVPYMLSALVVIWAVTYFLRGFPFLALRAVKDSPTMKYLSNTMPLGVMVILLVFAMSDPKFSSSQNLIPSALALLLTAVLHYRWANALISIGTGIASFCLFDYLASLLY